MELKCECGGLVMRSARLGGSGYLLAGKYFDNLRGTGVSGFGLGTDISRGNRIKGGGQIPLTGNKPAGPAFQRKSTPKMNQLCS
ncbi:hypothetical protein Holit_02492 [Hollandina sp. SP2]